MTRKYCPTERRYVDRPAKTQPCSAGCGEIVVKPRRTCQACDEVRAEQVQNLYGRGRTVAEIVAKTGLSQGVVYRHVQPVREAEESPQVRAALLYLEEDLPVKAVAKELQINEAVAGEILRDAGIEIRKGRRSSSSRAKRSSRGEVGRAVRFRKREKTRPVNCSRSDGLTQKQADVLEIVRAAPEPLPPKLIKTVLRQVCVDRDYIDWTCVYYTLHYLKDKGLVDKVEDADAPTRIWLWFAADVGPAEALTADEAARRSELRHLIEEQAEDAERGIYVKNTGADSLDRQVRGTESLTVLDTIGREDQGLDEVVEFL